MLPPVKVLFIIVSYNGMAWLERCLGSIAASSVPGTQVDLFVVDNDSTDGSADFVEAHFPQARLTRCAENLGFTAANNLGFAYAMRKGYDYVYLLNQDAWLEEGALAALLDAAAAHPEYAVLSPLQLQADGASLDLKFRKLMKRACKSVEEARDGAMRSRDACRPRHRERKGPTSDNEVGRIAPQGRTSSEPLPLSGEGGPHETGSPEIIPLPFVMAAHWLVPVKALQEIGTFAELFPLYGQDDNWCDRARFHGWKIGVVPSARAIHDRAARTESKDRLIERNYYNTALVRLADINHPLWLSWLYVCLFTPVQALKYRSRAPFRLFSALCRHNAELRALRQTTNQCSNL